MTAQFAVQPSTAFSDADQNNDIGPDHAASVPLSTEEIAANAIKDRMPKVNRRNTPRSADSTKRTADAKPSGLGMNVERASGIRKLGKSDSETIARMYTFAGMSLFPINQRLAKSIVDGSDTCGEAWVEWANKNDKLRRRILAFMEGGAATKVAMAHMPILIAAIPPELVAKVAERFGGMMSAPDSEAE